MYNNAELSDVELIFKNERINAHKAILSMNPYMRGYIRFHGDKDIINIEDMFGKFDEKLVLFYIKYLYRVDEKIDLNPELVEFLDFIQDTYIKIDYSSIWR